MTCIRFVLPVLLLHLFAACQNNFLLEEDKPIANGQWLYSDSLDFHFTVTDTTALYNLYLDFDHAADFPSQNLYVRLHTRFPDGKRLSKSRSFDFFDGQGNPIGKCSGEECHLRTMLQENTYFEQPGEYVLTVEQFMRRDSLPGLKAVGVAVERVKEKRDKK